MSGRFAIRAGTCHPVFVFEIAFSVDLDQAARRLHQASERAVLQHRERTPGPFEFRPAPLRIVQQLGEVNLPGIQPVGTVDLVLYEFGAASVSYTIPLPSDPADVLALSIALRGHGGLAVQARQRITALVSGLGPAVQRPRIAEPVEDYVIFELTALDGVEGGSAFVGSQADWIARVLRAEPGGLAAEEVREATSARLSFGTGDVTVVDWDSAIIVDPEPGDLRAVLEFANVQLLELRYLDDQLDQILDRSYHMLSRRGGWRAITLPISTEERRQLSALQVDSAILLERVTNALKFLGEEYLARLYRLAAGRLHLAEWDGVITRKLATVESIYQKLTDRADARRMELLEWVIIVLIALEIALTFWR